MYRLATLSTVAVWLLASCGGVITITLPGGGSSAGGPPAGYERLLNDTPHGFRMAQAGEPVRRGRTSERYELRDGDCGGSDCGKPWYRTEIRETAQATQARLGDDIWYGWSFYNENIASGTADTTLGAVIGQWKQGGDQPPVFRIVQDGRGEGNWAACDTRICTRNPDPALDVVVELEDMRQAANWGAAQNFGKICKLFSMDQNRGKWVDIVVNTNFSSDTNGYLRVWVNGVQTCDYYGRLVSDPRSRKGDAGPGHRRGIYASAPQRWTRSQGGAPKPTLIAYYDEFLVGNTRADVDPAAREARKLPPKD
jgi:hypothetical protein